MMIHIYDDIFINMHFPVEMKINCFTWLITTKSSKKLQRNFHRRYGRNAEASTIKAINRCSKTSRREEAFTKLMNAPAKIRR